MATEKAHVEARRSPGRRSSGLGMKYGFVCGDRGWGGGWEKERRARKKSRQSGAAARPAGSSSPPD